MADNVTYQSATPATPPSGTIVSADQDSVDSSLVQRVKLAYSADGVSTHVQADADGLLVNLGVNNDVTVTNTVTVQGSGAFTISDGGGSGSITVDDGGLSLTVDGTVAVSGVVHVDDNAGSLTVDGTVTETNSASALTSLQTIDNIVVAEDAPHVSGDSGVMALTVRKDTETQLGSLDGDYVPLQTDANGSLYVKVVSSLSDAVTIQDGGGSISINDDGLSITVDDGGGSLTVDGTVAVSSVSGTVTTAPQPSTSGGLSIYRSLDVGTTVAQIKGSAGQLYGWYITNRATSPRYIKFFNATAASVTLGTTTPVMTLEIPGNSTDHIAANALGAMGIAFSTAISVAATTGLLDSDTGAPSANDVVVNIFYK